MKSRHNGLGKSSILRDFLKKLILMDEFKDKNMIIQKSFSEKKKRGF